jgi:hypothetical protein
MTKPIKFLLFASIAIALGPRTSVGAEFPCQTCLPQSIKPIDYPPHGTLTHRRHPAPHRQCDERCVAKRARPSDDHRYTGYYVGGGAASPHGDPRGVSEGTWGWDYQGGLLPRRVSLNWWHGRRTQGGTGAYKTDGPHVWKRIREAISR